MREPNLEENKKPEEEEEKSSLRELRTQEFFSHCGQASNLGAEVEIQLDLMDLPANVNSQALKARVEL